MERERTLTALLVEDDERLAAFTAAYLEENAIRVELERDGDGGLARALRQRFDVILLDLLLPGRHGLDVCRELVANTETPIIILSGRGEEADRVLGLELGADDYLVKPFSPRELVARIRAVLRRSSSRATPGRLVAAGPLELDPAARTARLRGAEIRLTTHEFSLLLALAERAGQVLGREQLHALVPGPSRGEALDRAVDVRMSRLRRKLERDPRHPRLLVTVRGVGYVLAPHDS